ncbi:P-loop containing nucleoside triphosphate hydrolase protein, partial [Gamsiella multidivaricata]|uniref:P-loop containing nucleoside triphosphate hydrolase protein n=1 Tax=Gamsiella multidivaricata TaxID=101098 RepID=UPI00221F1576
YKVVVLGDRGVGNNSLTVQFCSYHYMSSYQPTIENLDSKRLVIGNDSYLLDILNTAGEPVYKILKDRWIQRGDGFLLVYSTADLRSFWKIKLIWDDILAFKGGPQPPMILTEHIKWQSRSDSLGPQECHPFLPLKWAFDVAQSMAKQNEL